MAEIEEEEKEVSSSKPSSTRSPSLKLSGYQKPDSGEQGVGGRDGLSIS